MTRLLPLSTLAAALVVCTTTAPRGAAALIEDRMLADEGRLEEAGSESGAAFLSDHRDDRSLMSEADDLRHEARGHLAASESSLAAGDAEGAAAHPSHAHVRLGQLRSIGTAMDSLHSSTERSLGSAAAMARAMGAAESELEVGEGAGDSGRREIRPDAFGNYNIEVTDTDIPPEVSKAVEPAAEKVFRSFMRWFEKVYLAPRGNGGHTGGCFGFSCQSFGQPQGMHTKNR
jgi:hypothetical protein